MSADPWTRDMENRMTILLEEQERQIMMYGEAPPSTDRHELSMIRDIEQNLKKLNEAKTHKETEKRAGSLITGIRWTFDGVKPQKVVPAGTLTETDLAAWVKLVSPKIESIIRARERGLVNLEITQAVLNQLLMIQNLAKQLAGR